MLKGLYLLIVMLLSLLVAEPASSYVDYNHVSPPPTYEESVDGLCEELIPLFSEAIQFILETPEFKEVPYGEKNQFLAQTLNYIVKSVSAQIGKDAITGGKVLVNLMKADGTPHVIILLKFDMIEDPKVLQFWLDVQPVEPEMKPEPKPAPKRLPHTGRVEQCNQVTL